MMVGDTRDSRRERGSREVVKVLYTMQENSCSAGSRIKRDRDIYRYMETPGGFQGARDIGIVGNSSKTIRKGGMLVIGSLTR